MLGVAAGGSGGAVSTTDASASGMSGSLSRATTSATGATSGAPGSSVTYLPVFRSNFSSWQRPQRQGVQQTGTLKHVQWQQQHWQP